MIQGGKQHMQFPPGRIMRARGELEKARVRKRRGWDATLSTARATRKMHPPARSGHEPRGFLSLCDSKLSVRPFSPDATLSATESAPPPGRNDASLPPLAGPNTTHGGCAWPLSPLVSLPHPCAPSLLKLLSSVGCADPQVLTASPSSPSPSPPCPENISSSSYSSPSPLSKVSLRPSDGTYGSGGLGQSPIPQVSAPRDLAVTVKAARPRPHLSKRPLDLPVCGSCGRSLNLAHARTESRFGREGGSFRQRPSLLAALSTDRAPWGSVRRRAC